MTATTLLAVEGLCSGYGSLQVLFDVSLDVREGEIVALMGSNGAGKTTTLRTITGLIRRSRGRVLFAGRDVSTTPTEALVARGMALVPEGRGMFRDLTVAENLELGAYSLRDRSGVGAATELAYTTFPILGERRNQKAGRLSGGQQQMLAIARSLMSNPKLLLVDEASLGLSPIMTETVFDLIAEVRRSRGTAVLIVEQNVAALALADRAFVLEHGQVVDRAEGEAVRTMQGRLRDVYLGRSTARAATQSSIPSPTQSPTASPTKEDTP
ncbi:MAG: ABC transporter ATP-binding protein [Acidimicrobiia bacterium]